MENISQHASQDRISIDGIIKSLQIQREEKYRAAIRKRIVLDYSPADFTRLMKAFAELVMSERGEYSEFTIDCSRSYSNSTNTRQWINLSLEIYSSELP